MTVTASAMLLLGTSVASGTCCLATSRAWQARALAVLMAVLMAAMALGAAPSAQYALAGVVLIAAAMSLPLLRGDRLGATRHRMVGAGLMVVLTLLHLHVNGGPGEHGDVTAVVPGHDVAVLRVLQAWTVAYLIWTVYLDRRSHKAPTHDRPTPWLRLEMAAMGSSTAIMAFGLT